tara:strand:+ start:1774 stop:2790 length:1017 start_codon:yes stop_codon:yes gene_type:complete
MIIKSYEIKKNISNVIKNNLFLFYGENSGIKKEIKELIKKKIENGEKIELFSLYENDILNNEESFYNTIFSGSLFSNKKIVTIQNATDKIFSTIEYVVDNCPKNTFIIILSELLEKKSKLRNLFEKDNRTFCIPCYLDNDRDLEIILNTELKKNNIIMSREAANILIEKSNKDRINLNNEIEKIKSYALHKKTLEINEIKSIVNFAGDYKSDEFINECLCGNINQYKKILSELYVNTINHIFLLRILSNKIHRLINMKKIEKNFSDIDNLLNNTKPKIFWKEKPLVKKQLNIWNLKDLLKIISDINKTEITYKKNPQISKIIFFNFFTEICKRANSFS